MWAKCEKPVPTVIITTGILPHARVEVMLPSDASETSRGCPQEVHPSQESSRDMASRQ